jgi:hypothetical protein
VVHPPSPAHFGFVTQPTAERNNKSGALKVWQVLPAEAARTEVRAGGECRQHRHG